MLKSAFRVASALLCLLPVQAFAESEADLDRDPIAFYQQRYGLPDVFQKRVDNKGNGDERLYGVRNFRAVLNGVVFRGGANNVYHRRNERENRNPLPQDGLTNLCQEGFAQAIYLYSTNFDKAPTSTACRSLGGASNHLNYQSVRPLAGPTEAQAILRTIHETLISRRPRPIYLHCWNGWHASGYISALTLRQFCGVSGSNAVEYWNRNTDGVNVGDNYERIRAKIRAFVPDPSMRIDRELQAKICPDFRRVSESID